MRIAFTSCFSAVLHKKQPVWDEIAAADPQVLVLLGDSIYLDCSDAQLNASALQQASEWEFAQHAHKLYAAQLNQRQFRQLVQRPGLATHAIWDDHDFLWNDARGADVMRNPALAPLVYPSRALFQAYREALAKRLAPGSFPAQPPAWSNNTPAPGYTMVPLEHAICLHLTDGRSWRRGGGAALLGGEQLDAVEAAMDRAPAGTVHLLASASVFEARTGESWVKCQPEYRRMLALAQRHDILFLSGDVHDNNLASYLPRAGSQHPLYEATASGAALRTDVNFGSLLRNWGQLDIDEGTVRVRIFKSGAEQYHCTIDRASWKVVAA